MEKTTQLFIIGIVFGLVLTVLILGIANGGAPLFYLAAQFSTQTAQASASVNAFVETSISPATITFGALDPNTADNNATSNPTNLTNTANSNSKIDIYLNATDLVNDTYVIGLGNLSVSATDGGEKTAFTGSWLNNTTPNNGYYEDVNKSTVKPLWFYLTIPAGQDAGDYTGNVTIKSVKNGGTP